MSMWPLVYCREGLSEVNRAMGKKGGLRVMELMLYARL
jgi:hypothetical protein